MDILRPTIVGTSTGMGTSDESSCDDSTGPTTPDSSSIFYPSSLPEDIIRTPLSLCLKDSKSMSYNVSKANAPALTLSTGVTPVPPTIRNICMIGAGYVGMFSRHSYLFASHLSASVAVECARIVTDYSCAYRRPHCCCYCPA